MIGSCWMDFLIILVPFFFIYNVNLIVGKINHNNRQKCVVQINILDTVVRESPPILQLFSSECKTLKICRNPILVFDLGLELLDRIAGLHLQSELTSQSSFGYYKNLHGASLQPIT